MPSDNAPPAEVVALLELRRSARRQTDWARADALRVEIAALGWEVQDGSGQTTVRAALPSEPVATGYADSNDLASLIDEPPGVAASIQLVADEHPDDLRRMLTGLREHLPATEHELIVVANAPTFDLDAMLGEGPESIIVRTSQRLGWADSRNLGLRRSRGAITVLLDTSLEPSGDFLTPLLDAFDDPKVGIAGGWGVRSADGREFQDATPGEVDAVEGYCLAVRRDALRQVPAFDRRFRFYRNADLDFSFALRDAGWRAVRTQALPFVRHEHRGYTSLPDVERDRLSRRNFYRFLDHWGDRRDLLLEPVP
ncbi:MAG: glycosyltransferase, partial [Candidatus Limnocylindria bacterium]